MLSNRPHYYDRCVTKIATNNLLKYDRQIVCFGVAYCVNNGKNTC